MYRHSFLAHYAVVNVETGDIHTIAPPAVATSNEPEPSLQNFLWSPTGTALAFVYKNNVFYKPDLESDAEQLTTDGVVGIVYNGLPDWVYEGMLHLILRLQIV